MRQVFPTEHGELRVTCSLGVAAFPGDGADFGALFAKADGALYVAKQSGRNQSRVAGSGAVRAA
jgi:diguanylate cyclase (GGDEF)-like protein